MVGQGFFNKKTKMSFFLMILALTFFGAFLSFLNIELSLIGYAIPALFLVFTVLLVADSIKRDSVISQQNSVLWIISGAIVLFMYTVFQETYSKIGASGLFNNAIGPFFIGFGLSSVLYGAIIIGRYMFGRK